MPCSALTGRVSNPDCAKYSWKFRVMSDAAGSLPRRTLVAISHAEAALTTIVFCFSSINRRTESGSEELSVIHQIRAWVSSERCNRNYSQASSSSGGRGSKNSGPISTFPFHAPGLR